MLAPPTISYLTDIYFDFGVLKILPDLLKRNQLRRPLIITDRGLVQLGIIDRLGIETAALFDRVETNPTEVMAIEALSLYRQSACDGIIAVGGGSPVDLAKCVAILVHHPPPLEQYAIGMEAALKLQTIYPYA